MICCHGNSTEGLANFFNHVYGATQYPYGRKKTLSPHIMNKNWIEIAYKPGRKVRQRAVPLSTLAAI